MSKTPSRRDFLKSGLAASAILMVGTKATSASQGPQLFEKSSIETLELPESFHQIVHLERDRRQEGLRNRS